MNIIIIETMSIATTMITIIVTGILILYIAIYFILKLVSAIFYQIFFFLPNNSPSKAMKNVFYFIKKFFSFSRYSNSPNFPPSFPHIPDSKRKIEMHGLA